MERSLRHLGVTDEGESFYLPQRTSYTRRTSPLMFNFKDFIRDKGDDWTGYTVILPRIALPFSVTVRISQIWGKEKESYNSIKKGVSK